MSLLRFKLVFFVPRDSTSKVLDHLFGKFHFLGKIGNYERCAFITPGIGQFKPIGEAKPTIGSVGQVETVEENRVEVLVSDRGHLDEVRSVISELKNVHPYEEVAYDVYKLETI